MTLDDLDKQFSPDFLKEVDRVYEIAKLQGQGLFPIKIQYLDTKDELVIREPDDVEYGRSFKVLETNVT